MIDRRPAPTAADLGLMQGAPPPAERLVTLDNWQDPPFNRWGFQHVRDLVPSARIPRGEDVWPFQADARDVDGIEFELDGERWTVGEMLDATFTDGFLVLRDGRIVDERYRNGLTPSTTHLLMSVSKSIVATVAGILAGRGELDPDGPLTDLVPELRRTAWDGASLRDLLDMRAGIRFDEDYANADADVRVYEQVYLWRPRTDAGLPPDACSYMAGLAGAGRHGGAFDYRSILTDMLGWAVERAGRARLAELVSRELWQPMGAEFDAEVTVDPRGNAMADGGICATLRDIARFGRLWLDDGVRDGRRIVPEAWVRDTLAGAADSAEAFAGAEPDWPGAFYRNKWWVLDPAAPAFAARGINGQHVIVHVPARVVVAKLSTWPAADDPVYDRPTLAGAWAVAEALA